MGSVAESYINALKRAKKANSDDELAKALGLGKSTLASWRRRGAVPNEIAGDLLIDGVLDYLAVIHEHLAQSLASSDLGETMLLQAAMLLASEMNEHEIRQWAGWLAEQRMLIFRAVVKAESSGRPEEFLTDDHISVRLMALGARAARGDILTPELLKRLRRDYMGDLEETTTGSE